MNELIKTMLVKDEGLRLKPYRDTEGKLTIGVGRNLSDVGISIDEAYYLLANDVKRAEAEAKEIFADVWDELDDVRKAVIVNMLFNLGKTSFLTFRKFIAAVKAGDWQRAHKEMLNSRWARQVKSRAERLASMMLTGKPHPYYAWGE